MLRQTSGAIEHIRQILGAAPMPGSLEPQNTASVQVVFDKVCFSYGETPVLESISFTLQPNSMVALVGPSGAGKTTVANLLCRFWDPGEGSIRLNGQDLRTLSPEYVSRQISAVMQDVSLFNDTIYNNIRAGDITAPREKVLAAARKAQCEAFVSALPDGYETIIGESGSRLSGGERQRITIARALLKNAPIVILDEATASLDLDNEYHVQQAIEPLIQSKSLLVIAHRLSTIVHADQILFIEKGRIIQCGTFAELMQRQGRFKEFWDCQQQSARWKLGEPQQ